jgi:hypothetical protein
MRIRCDYCLIDLQAPSNAIGKTIRCPACGRSFPCRLPTAIVDDTAPDQPGESEVVLEEVVQEAPPELAFAGAVEPEPVIDFIPAEVPVPDDALAMLDKPKPVMKESSRQWHVIVAGVPAVALTLAELKERVAEGLVKPRHKIYFAPQDVTLPARDVPGLFPELARKRGVKLVARPSAPPVAAGGGKDDSAAPDRPTAP